MKIYPLLFESIQVEILTSNFYCSSEMLINVFFQLYFVAKRLDYGLIKWSAASNIV